MTAKVPTALKLLTGNPGKRRLPKNEPQPDSPLPDPPEQLNGDDYALQEWHRLAAGLHNLGLLYDVDRGTWAAVCKAYSRWRHAEEELQKIIDKHGHASGLIHKTKSGNLIPNPMAGVANAAMTRYVDIAQKFGLNPQARASLGVSAEKPGSKFDKFKKK